MLTIAWNAVLRDTDPPKLLTLTWEDFVHTLRKATFDGPKLNAPNWGPYRCRTARKTQNEDVEEITQLVLDADHLQGSKNPGLTAEEAQEVFSGVASLGCAFLWYTTASHTAEWQRRRAVIPLKEPVPAKHWRAARQKFTEMVKFSHLLDSNTVDERRIYFVPTVTPDADFSEWPGEPFDLKLFLGGEWPSQASSIMSKPVLELIDNAPKLTSVDIEQIRQSLRSWGSSDLAKNARARELLLGEPFGTVGTRDAEILALIGQIVGRFPQISDEELECLFLPSIVAMVQRDAAEVASRGWAEETVEHWMGLVLEKAERARPHAEEFQAGLAKNLALAEQASAAFAAKVRKPPLVDIPQLVESSVTERPTIRITTDLERVCDAAEKAVAEDPRIFCAPAGLVRLCAGGGRPLTFVREDDDIPTLAPLDHATLHNWLATAAKWVTVDGRTGKERPAIPPQWLVAGLMSHRIWPSVRRIIGFTETPAIRPDGSLLLAPGYDAKTGIYHIAKGAPLDVPENPTHKDALAARDEILEVVADFPWGGAASRSGWFAALLTPFIRRTLDGLVPMFAIDANTRGAGKTKLVDIISLICTGRLIPKMSNTTDDSEMRKRLLAIALSGKSQITFDNVKDTLGTPSLDSALTAGIIEDRVLGVNQLICAPLRVTWFATGNNLSYEGDMVRRVLPIRLTSPLENPEERDDFKQRDLQEWILSRRPALVRACLICLRAYYLAGLPRGKTRPWGSFEAWQRVICGCVEWLGLEPPEAARTLLDSGPAEKEQMQLVMAAFEKAFQRKFATVNDFITKLGAPGNQFHDAKQALIDLCEGKGGEISAKRVGQLFRRYQDRVMGSRAITVRGGAATAIKQWRIETFGEPAHQKAHTAGEQNGQTSAA